MGMGIAGCKEYRKVDSTARWRKRVTSSSIRWQCSNVIGRAFTRKLTGFETTIVIIRTILRLKSRDFLMTSTIVLLKLMMSCNNSLRVSVLSLWRSKDRKNRFVINEIWKLISIKLLIFKFHKRNFMSWINGAMPK